MPSVGFSAIFPSERRNLKNARSVACARRTDRGERVMTPVDLRDTYNANRGSIHGMAGNSLRASLLRPPNRDRQIERLYFAGGAAHPGGGLPMVALSGKIVSDLVLEDFKMDRTGPATTAARLADVTPL